MSNKNTLIACQILFLTLTVGLFKVGIQDPEKQGFVIIFANFENT